MAEAAPAEAPVQPKLRVLSQYIRDMSFENIAAQQNRSDEVKPEITVQVNLDANKKGENSYEVILKVTINAKAGEEAVFILEVDYGGRFHVENVPEDQLHPFLMIECPRMLFPYLRRVVGDSPCRIQIRRGLSFQHPSRNCPEDSFWPELFAEHFRSGSPFAQIGTTLGPDLAGDPPIAPNRLPREFRNPEELRAFRAWNYRYRSDGTKHQESFALRGISCAQYPKYRPIDPWGEAFYQATQARHLGTSYQMPHCG